MHRFAGEKGRDRLSFVHGRDVEHGVRYARRRDLVQLSPPFAPLKVVCSSPSVQVSPLVRCFDSHQVRLAFRKAWRIYRRSSAVRRLIFEAALTQRGFIHRWAHAYIAEILNDLCPRS